MIQMSQTITFSQVWDKYSKFKTDYDASPFTGIITNNNLEILYYLLYAKYGNSPIANFDETQFKYKLFSLIFQYGPNWEKELLL